MAFAFDPRDRVNALNTAVTLGYDLNGRITGVTYPNTVAMSASYDALTGRLSDLAHTLGAADLARFAYLRLQLQRRRLDHEHRRACRLRPQLRL
jgi:YD repeat-containing protein